MELKQLKKEVLQLVAKRAYDQAIVKLRLELDPQHPSYSRVERLDGQNKRLIERINQGTVRETDVQREEQRISGALKDLAYELEDNARQAEAAGKEKFVFKFRDLEGNTAAEDGKEEVREDLPFGYRGDFDYTPGPAAKQILMVLSKGYKSTYHAVVQGLKNGGVTIESGDREGGKILAAIPPSASSRYGETVVAYVRPENRGRTELTLIVDSRDPRALFDLGRNQQKVNLLAQIIRG